MKKTLKVVGINTLISVFVLALSLYFKGLFWHYLKLFAAFNLMTPVLILQIAMPSGFLKKIETELPNKNPLAIKIVLYLLIFPVANIWMISIANLAFNLLPDFHLAIEQGKDIETIILIKNQWRYQLLITTIIACLTIFFIGIILKMVMKKK